MSTGTPVFDPVPSHPPVIGQPAWDVALLYPPQGQWSEEEYLKLTDHTRRLVEYTDGKIEVLSMPTIELQRILKFLLWALDSFVMQNKLGEVLLAGTRVYIDPKKYREPDVVFCSTARRARSGTRYYEGADLVMEVAW
jgi:Uma2 family endonuclease